MTDNVFKKKHSIVNKQVVFVAACAGMLLFGMVLTSLGSVLPTLEIKYKLDALTAGSLASLLPVGILVGSIFFGPIADKYGYRALFSVNTLLVGFGFAGMALAPSVGMIQASIFFVGLGGGVLNGVTNAVVADISDERKGARLSLLGVFYGVGALTMPTLLGMVMGFMSVQQALGFLAMVILLIAAVFAFIRFPAPKQQGYSLKPALRLLRDPAILLLGLYLFLESGMEGVVGNWITKYAGNVLGFDQQAALFALSVHVAAITCMRLLLGSVLKGLSVLVTLVGSLILAAAGTVLLLTSSGPVLSLVAVGLLGMGFAAVFPTILGLVAEHSPAFSGTAFGIVLAMALVGNTASNYSVGVLIDQTGTIAGMPYLFLVYLAVMALIVSVTVKKAHESIQK